MKKALQILLAFTILATACKKDDFSKKDEYEDSYKKYTDFKSTYANSYTYTVENGSVFGSSSTTVITIKNGKAIGRSYKYYRRSDDGKSSVLTLEWNEDESSINTHKEAADALTLDQIYDKAKTFWLKADKKTNKVYFESNLNGLISSCGFVPNGCQDDCFNGITITSIKGLTN